MHRRICHCPNSPSMRRAGRYPSPKRPRSGPGGPGGEHHGGLTRQPLFRRRAHENRPPQVLAFGRRRCALPAVPPIARAQAYCGRWRIVVALTAGSSADILEPYFPQVEEAIRSEFFGPFHDMKACFGTASRSSTSRCKCVNSTSNVCTALPLWTSLLRAARLNSRKSCSVVGWAQSRCSG